MRRRKAAREVATSTRGTSFDGNAKRIARICCNVEIGGRPRELRESFVEAMHQSIQNAWSSGRIDIGVAEELIRALPVKGRA
jgi:hypothetical protein